MRQVARVDEARVGLYEKGIAPSVDQAMTNDSPDRRLEVSSVVPLMAPAAGYGEEAADTKDPHFWLDPVLLGQVADAFAATMAARSQHAARQTAPRRCGRC